MRFALTRATSTDYEGRVLFLPPKLTIAATPSSPIPTADPRPLLWVTGIVLGILVLWVAYVFFAGDKRVQSASAKTSGDGAK